MSRVAKRPRVAQRPAAANAQQHDSGTCKDVYLSEVFAVPVPDVLPPSSTVPENYVQDLCAVVLKRLNGDERQALHMFMHITRILTLGPCARARSPRPGVEHACISSCIRSSTLGGRWLLTQMRCGGVCGEEVRQR